MNFSTDQTDKVSAFFDRISCDYRERYGPQKPFHSYVFRERLQAATEGIQFENKIVLDVGAGTGSLYDYLAKYPSVDYYACDISSMMLSQSRIPAGRAFTGKATEIRFPKDKFDYIYLLGVTTYQTPEELIETLRFIRKRLAPDGQAIVSFTNRSSADHALRRILRVARPLIRNGVFGQAFTTYAYKLGAVEDMISTHGLHLNRVIYLNQTISPFNTLLPQPSVSLAWWLSRNCPASLLSFCSADFLLFLGQKTPPRQNAGAGEGRPSPTPLPSTP
jgi:SAM-dependent methyltransferase